ncbi:MAG: hypothetical protein K6G22_04895 [Lachnospiraceae bacterium]|nr:hypothetical protein [Lachnospiraceae bacterium]
MNGLIYYINSFKTEDGQNSDTKILRSVIIAVVTLLYGLICLLFDITLMPYQVFSVLYLFTAVILTRQVLKDAYKKNGNSIPVMLTYLPAAIWFVLFTYFDLFFIGFGPARGFRSVMTSLLYFVVILLFYVLITFLMLDNIYEHFSANKKQALWIGVGAALVSIIIVWYFSLRAFYSTESKIGLTKELCIDSFGWFTHFWSVLGFFK